MSEAICGIAFGGMVPAAGGNALIATRLHRTALTDTPTTRKSSLDQERDRVVL
jgi:hypothetical protein